MTRKKRRVSRSEDRVVCGIVMPISEIDGCSDLHWTEVRDIISDSIEMAGCDPQLVSEAEDIGIIQQRIIQNLYENPIVVCDVSGKNPNVMFELGLRLAFDKPTIIVKDERTAYSFDTSPIEHLEYPRDLRFNRIEAFKEELAEKIKGTLKRAKADPAYTPFLKHFGAFTAAKLHNSGLSKEDYIIEELKNIRLSVSDLTSKVYRPGFRPRSVCIHGEYTTQQLESVCRDISKHLNGVTAELLKRGPTHHHILLRSPNPIRWDLALSIAKATCRTARLL